MESGGGDDARARRVYPEKLRFGSPVHLVHGREECVCIQILWPVHAFRHAYYSCASQRDYEPGGRGAFF